MDESQLRSRHNETEVTMLRQKLAETTLLLEILAYVNSLLSNERNFEKFCSEVCRVLREKFNFTYLHIWIREKERPHMLRLVTPETKDGFRHIDVKEGMVGKCIRLGRTICTPDVRLDPDYLNIHPETKSELCIPLICDGNAIGALNIETEKPNTFSGQLAIVEIIAEKLSHALKLALLYQTEEQFHHLVEQMTEGVWVGDRSEKTLYTNPSLQRILGVTAEEFKTMTSHDFFDEPSKKILEGENQKRRKGVSSHYEATLISKNGELIPALIHAIPFGSNGGSMATITDMRPLKNAEQKLVRTEQFLTSITKYSIEAIIGLDQEGRIQSWNVGAERMYGFRTEDAVTKSIDELIFPEDKKSSKELQQLITETKAKGFTRNFETVRLHKNGNPITVSLTWSAIKGSDGRIIGFSALHRDITTQKKWERELQDRFEKMQDAYREMGRQRRYLDYLTDTLNMAVSNSFSKKQIAMFIVNAIVMISKVDAATLRFLEPNTGKLQLIAQSGLGEDWWSKKSPSYQGSLLEMAVKQGQPLKILDILNEPHYTSQALARKNNLHSALVLPLQAKNEVLGSLTLYLSQENSLSLLDDEFITIFAKQASVALKLAD